MNNIHYNWQEISHRNRQICSKKNFKYVHHLDYASFHERRYYHKTNVYYRKEFKKVKYVYKCSIPEHIQIDKGLRENFSSSKNSIQTMSLKTRSIRQEYILEENIEISKILSCARNLQRIRWEYNSEGIEGSLDRFTSSLPRNKMQGLRIPLPRYLQIQFQFTFFNMWSQLPSKFQGFPMFKALISCQGTPWKVTSLSLFVGSELMRNWDIRQMLIKLYEIEEFSMHIVGQETWEADVREFFWLCGNMRVRKLKKFEMKLDVDYFDPKELDLLEGFPESLERFRLRIEAENMLVDEKTIENFLAFGKRINGLKKLKTLDMRFPTTFYVNQMVRDMKEGMEEMEEVLLEFIEAPQHHEVYEDFDVSSCVKWLATMPKLKRIKLKATKLNFNDCEQTGGFENLESIEWIDDSLERIRKGSWDYKTKKWVECQKLEDLGAVLGLINEEKTENIEIPLVFEGLAGDVGLRRFMEKVDRMRNLKRLRLYVGFGLLEEEHVRLMEDFLNGFKLKGEEVECFVCYRELSMKEIEKRKGKNNHIDFVLCPCP